MKIKVGEGGFLETEWSDEFEEIQRAGCKERTKRRQVGRLLREREGLQLARRGPGRRQDY